jgi:hypothetical protein
MLRAWSGVLGPKFLAEWAEEQKQVPVRLRSGQAFDSPPPNSTPKSKDRSSGTPETEKRLGPLSLRMTGHFI